MVNVLIGLMLIILYIVFGFVAFVGGYVYRKAREENKQPRAQPELSAEEKTKFERWQKEYDNFMKFDGSQQE